jgi:hypothetical protein
MFQLGSEGKGGDGIEKFAIIELQTMVFAIIGLQTWTSLKRPLKDWHFAITGFLLLLMIFLN